VADHFTRTIFAGRGDAGGRTASPGAPQPQQ